ncbi:sterile alpha and armadillo motif isoform X2 [Haematobia irritans]|uniref:sterile alpha and armadillo motif isoform X2 n=1 Tax=Haematobia irritans TaxID=7368 RepID=UPI003F4FFF0A
MSDFSDSSQSGVISPATSFIENFHKKNGTAPSTSSSSANTSPSINPTNVGVITSPAINGGASQIALAGGGRQINTSSSSVKETSSTSSQQVVNSSSSSTTTRVEKKSRLHHITSSSSTSSSSSSSTEMKAAALKRDMSEFKNSMSEINELALGRNASPALTGSTGTLSHHQPPSINDLSNLNALNSADAINKLKKKLRSSLENIVDGNSEPHITFPDDSDDNDMNLNMDLVKASNQLSTNGLSGSKGTLVDTVKFEEKRTKTESKTKVITDGFSSEQATSNLAESKRLQTGDIDYQQAKAAAATRNRMEVDGVKTEENAAVIHVDKFDQLDYSANTSQDHKRPPKSFKTAAPNDMTNQAPWPVRKGIFRSSGQSDFIPTRSPSPIVEMPLSPPPMGSNSRGSSISRFDPNCPLSPPPQPIQVIQGPLGPTASSSAATTKTAQSAQSTTSSSSSSSSSSGQRKMSQSASANTAAVSNSAAAASASMSSSSASASSAHMSQSSSSSSSSASRSEALSLRTGDVTQQASNNVAAASIKVQSDTFSADKKAISQSQQSQTMTSNGIISQEKHMSSAAQANYTMTSKGVTSSGGSSMISSSSQMSTTNGSFFKLADFKLDDLTSLRSNSDPKEIEQAISKYSNMLTSCVNSLQEKKPASEETLFLDKINEVIRRAWAVPTHGHELGYSLCNSLRSSGGLDLLMRNCVQGDMHIKFSSAKLLEQCLTTENRTHVVDNGLDKVVNVACVCTKKQSTEHSRVGTGILEHLFKHSEGTCSDVIKLGGLDAVLFECRTSDVETLRHCASALANLSLYGGAENQEAMILRKVPMWLFPLAFHNDDNIKYYACLAIAVLVANKEIEAEVLKSGCLDLVEPFVTTHDPSEFAKSNLAHAHGQSKHWLQRLVPVLSSNREEARSLAAFHFCMEAGIKREQGNTEIFREIGAIEALKTVASCPNAIASKFAAQALRLIGETVPHKLSQQVPLWSVEDVQEWVKQIGFGHFVRQFEESQVDGDLLLKLTDKNLRDDIGIANGILLKRFERELQNLKRMADYSSKDTAKLHQFLAEIGPEYCTYTYSMLNAGIDKNYLPHLNEDMLIQECNITNSIHRLRILNAVKSLVNTLSSASEESMAKTLDVFVSYRRSNGSQLASLLKVHLQLRGFSVFIDVERLEAGKFDNGLLNSIRQAKNFVLVLTPNALERCVDDNECKDWVHREIVAALNANCNIIPIIDNQFNWPESERLPEDMRSVCHFNGVTWIHDYQDACIDKLERFMRGEKNIDRITAMTPGTPGSTVSYQRMHSNDSEYSVGGSNAGSNSGSGGGGGGGNSGSTNGGGQASHQANRYRQSASPARQRLGPGLSSSMISSTGKLGSTGSQLSVFGRGSKRNLLPPYRTHQPTTHNKALPIGGSMQNVSPLAYRPPRRSSAVGICNDGSSNGKAVASTNFRSHSVDGLLDGGSSESSEQKIAEAAALVSAGSLALTNASSTSTLQPNGEEDYNGSLNDMQCNMEVSVPRREKSSNLPPINPQHRKSRSLDHFLDEQTLASLAVPPSPTDGTQSMENLATLHTPEPVRSPIALTVNGGGIGSTRSASVRDSKSLTPERVSALRQSPSNRQSPEGISSADDETEDTQSLKSSQSVKSAHSTPTVGTATASRPPTSAPKNQTRAAAHIHRGSSSRVSKTTSSTSLGAPSTTAAGSSSSSAAAAATTGGAHAVNNTNNPNNKTIFNRTIKKVRSLIKNNDLANDEIPDILFAKGTPPSPGRILFW